PALSPGEKRRARDKAVWQWVFLGLSVALTWYINTITNETLYREFFGPVSGLKVGLALCGALDLFFLGTAVNSLLSEARQPLRGAHHKFIFALVSLSVATFLAFSGLLQRTYSAVGLKAPGPVASIGMLQTS